jgi:hypothetical protein
MEHSFELSLTDRIAEEGAASASSARHFGQKTIMRNMRSTSVPSASPTTTQTLFAESPGAVAMVASGVLWLREAKWLWVAT